MRKIELSESILEKFLIKFKPVLRAVNWSFNVKKVDGITFTNADEVSLVKNAFASVFKET